MSPVLSTKHRTFFFLHGRWCPLYVCSFFFCNTPPTCNHHHCINTPPLHRKGGGRRAVGYRKVALKLLANSCRCSVGGETIRLSSQSLRVRYSAPHFFFPDFFFPFFFLYFFSMGGGILCMYVPFFCATHHPPVITTAVLRGAPTLRAHCTHASSGRSWAAGSSFASP